MADVSRTLVRSDNWKALSDRVEENGGRIVHVHAKELVIIELPEGVTPAMIGTQPIEDTPMSPIERAVADTLRLDTSRPAEEIIDPGPPLDGWDSPGSPLAGEREDD